MQQEVGTLVLKAVPSDEVEEEVKAFLGKVFRNVSHEKVANLIRKAPVVLSKNVSAKTGAKIVANLERLGATVDFLPRTEAPKQLKKALKLRKSPPLRGETSLATSLVMFPRCSSQRETGSQGLNYQY